PRLYGCGNYAEGFRLSGTGGIVGAAGAQSRRKARPDAAYRERAGEAETGGECCDGARGDGRPVASHGARVSEDELGENRDSAAASKRTLYVYAAAVSAAADCGGIRAPAGLRESGEPGFR